MEFRKFTENIKRRLPKSMLEDILRVRANSVQEIQEQAQEYFNLPIEDLCFEIEHIYVKTDKKKYSIIVYPRVEFQSNFNHHAQVKNKNGEAFVRFENGTALLLVTASIGTGKAISFSDVKEIVDKK